MNGRLSLRIMSFIIFTRSSDRDSEGETSRAEARTSIEEEREREREREHELRQRRRSAGGVRERHGEHEEDTISAGTAITILVQELREKYRQVQKMLRKREYYTADDVDLVEDSVYEIINLADAVINLTSKTVTSTLAQRLSHKLYQQIKPLQDAYASSKIELLETLESEDLANLPQKLRNFMMSFERLYTVLQGIYVGRERVKRREVEILIAPSLGTIIEDVQAPALSPEARRVLAILLANGGEVPISHLANVLSREQLTRAVNELERKGYATRLYDPSLGEDKLVLSRE